MTLPFRRLVISLFALIVVAAGAYLTVPSAFVQRAGAETDTKVFVDDGFAIRGYDPVAYFTEGAPREGSDAHTADWNGATWRFASAANREAFLAEPERYAPQYGGYCAWGVATKKNLYSTQPDAWSIVDGKLYLNYSAGVREQWSKDVPKFITDGDAAWPELSKR